MSRSLEKASRKVQQETQRVITDHLPTIFATAFFQSPEVDLNSKQEIAISLGKQYLPVRRPIPPEEVANHIKVFFAKADEVIEQIGRGQKLRPSSVDKFKLLFRKLYTVASIESHVAAIESGRAVAINLAGGDEAAVLCPHRDRRSAELFERSARLAFTEDPYESKQKPQHRVVLLIDDVAHSGDQITAHLHGAHLNHPGLPVVISLGTVTDRAMARLREEMESHDVLIFQEKKLSLAEMIDQIKSPSVRKELRMLAEDFFDRHTLMLDGINATHIITSFKLPDGVSNGCLGTLSIQGICHHFSVKPVEPSRDRLYPEVI